MEREAKHLLIVTAPAGLVKLDKPIARSAGARQLGAAIPVGQSLYAYSIHVINGVPYALLQSISSMPEWVRVQEADGSRKYVDVIDLDPPNDASQYLYTAVQDIANSIRYLGDCIKDGLVALAEIIRTH